MIIDKPDEMQLNGIYVIIRDDSFYIGSTQKSFSARN